MKQTEYMKGWSHAGWMVFTITFLIVLFCVFLGECSAQIQNQHLSVIAKKNTAGVTEYDLGDTTFAYDKWNADPSTWWSNENSTTFYPSGSGDYLAYSGSGTESVYNKSTYQVNVTWEHTGMTDKDLTFEWYQATGTNVSLRIRIGKDGDWDENIVNPSNYYSYGSYSSGYNTIDWTCPYDTINSVAIAFTTSDTCRIDYVKLYDQ